MEFLDQKYQVLEDSKLRPAAINPDSSAINALIDQCKRDIDLKEIVKNLNKDEFQ